MDFVKTIRHDFSFPGHVLPGTAFIIMGLWWMINTFRIHFHLKESSSSFDSSDEDEEIGPFIHCNSGACKFNNSKNSQFYSATFNGCSARLFGCEGFIKLLYASFDLFCHILVVVTGGSLVDEAQHMTVYLFFILNALVDITIFLEAKNKDGRSRSRFFPSGSDFVMGAIAWIGFGFLFLSHKHHKSEIQIYYHSLLAWVAIVVGIAHLIQWRFQRNVIASIFRACCSIMAGTWLYQIAFTFHNPFITPVHTDRGLENGGFSIQTVGVLPLAHVPHDHITMEHGHENVMRVMFGSTIFTWHVISIFIFTVVTGLLISRRKSNAKDYTIYTPIPQC